MRGGFEKRQSKSGLNLYIVYLLVFGLLSYVSIILSFSLNKEDFL